MTSPLESNPFFSSNFLERISYPIVPEDKTLESQVEELRAWLANSPEDSLYSNPLESAIKVAGTEQRFCHLFIHLAQGIAPRQREITFLSKLSKQELECGLEYLLKVDLPKLPRYFVYLNAALFLKCHHPLWSHVEPILKNDLSALSHIPSPSFSTQLKAIIEPNELSLIIDFLSLLFATAYMRSEDRSLFHHSENYLFLHLDNYYLLIPRQFSHSAEILISRGQCLLFSSSLYPLLLHLLPPLPEITKVCVAFSREELAEVHTLESRAKKLYEHIDPLIRFLGVHLLSANANDYLRRQYIVAQVPYFPASFFKDLSSALSLEPASLSQWQQEASSQDKGMECALWVTTLLQQKKEMLIISLLNHPTALPSADSLRFALLLLPSLSNKPAFLLQLHPLIQRTQKKQLSAIEFTHASHVIHHFCAAIRADTPISHSSIESILALIQNLLAKVERGSENSLCETKTEADMLHAPSIWLVKRLLSLEELSQCEKLLQQLDKSIFERNNPERVKLWAKLLEQKLKRTSSLLIYMQWLNKTADLEIEITLDKEVQCFVEKLYFHISNFDELEKIKFSLFQPKKRAGFTSVQRDQLLFKIFSDPKHSSDELSQFLLQWIEITESLSPELEQACLTFIQTIDSYSEKSQRNIYLLLLKIEKKRVLFPKVHYNLLKIYFQYLPYKHLESSEALLFFSNFCSYLSPNSLFEVELVEVADLLFDYIKIYAPYGNSSKAKIFKSTIEPLLPQLLNLLQKSPLEALPLLHKIAIHSWLFPATDQNSKNWFSILKNCSKLPESATLLCEGKKLGLHSNSFEEYYEALFAVSQHLITSKNPKSAAAKDFLLEIIDYQAFMQLHHEEVINFICDNTLFFESEGFTMLHACIIWGPGNKKLIKAFQPLFNETSLDFLANTPIFKTNHADFYTEHFKKEIDNVLIKCFEELEVYTKANRQGLKGSPNAKILQAYNILQRFPLIALEIDAVQWHFLFFSLDTFFPQHLMGLLLLSEKLTIFSSKQYDFAYFAWHATSTYVAQKEKQALPNLYKIAYKHEETAVSDPLLFFARWAPIALEMLKEKISLEKYGLEIYATIEKLSFFKDIINIFISEEPEESNCDYMSELFLISPHSQIFSTFESHQPVDNIILKFFGPCSIFDNIENIYYQIGLFIFSPKNKKIQQATFLAQLLKNPQSLSSWENINSFFEKFIKSNQADTKLKVKFSLEFAKILSLLPKDHSLLLEYCAQNLSCLSEMVSCLDSLYSLSLTKVEFNKTVHLIRLINILCIKINRDNEFKDTKKLLLIILEKYFLATQSSKKLIDLYPKDKKEFQVFFKNLLLLMKSADLYGKPKNARLILFILRTTYTSLIAICNAQRIPEDQELVLHNAFFEVLFALIPTQSVSLQYILSLTCDVVADHIKAHKAEAGPLYLQSIFKILTRHATTESFQGAFKSYLQFFLSYIVTISQSHFPKSRFTYNVAFPVDQSFIKNADRIIPLWTSLENESNWITVGGQANLIKIEASFLLHSFPPLLTYSFNKLINMRHLIDKVMLNWDSILSEFAAEEAQHPFTSFEYALLSSLNSDYFLKMFQLLPSKENYDNNLNINLFENVQTLQKFHSQYYIFEREFPLNWLQQVRNTLHFYAVAFMALNPKSVEFDVSIWISKFFKIIKDKELYYEAFLLVSVEWFDQLYRLRAMRNGKDFYNEDFINKNSTSEKQNYIYEVTTEAMRLLDFSPLTKLPTADSIQNMKSIYNHFSSTPPYAAVHMQKEYYKEESWRPPT